MSYADQHPKTCSGCPLYETGRGFVLGCGDPTKARYVLILEAPGKDEISFSLRPNPKRNFLREAADCDKELALRKRDYPELDERFLRTGLPVVGATGATLLFWIFPKLGLRREEFFIDNTLRCLPPAKATGAYPTGQDRKLAEQLCRQYDRLDGFRPDTVVLSLHPASLLRDIVPLPLVVKDFEKLRDFASQGRKVMMLLGGKAAKAFLRYGDNSTRWRGHYTKLAANWVDTYKSLFSFVKKERKRKMREDKIQEAFGVPSTTIAKAKAKMTRPADLIPGPCSKAKRYRGKRPPRCGCAICWDRYEGAAIISEQIKAEST